MTLNKDSVAEAEVKFQLNDAEYLPLIKQLDRLGFYPAPDEYLTDYYLDFARSAFASYDFTRLRWPKEGKILLTRKHWVQDAEGNSVRMEDENEIEEQDAVRLREKNPDARKLIKKRQTFHGTIPPHQASIVIDKLTLKNKIYYFFECEVLTTREESEKTRQQLFQWAITQLPISAREEAPSMLEILLKDEE